MSKPMINVQVEKNNNENNLNLLRRFTKRVQGSGVLNRVRGLRYFDRPLSKYNTKKFALKALNYRTDMDLKIKLGKIKPVVRK